MPKQPAPVPQVAPDESDLEERIQKFNNELMPLLGKYELGLTAVAEGVKEGLPPLTMFESLMLQAIGQSNFLNLVPIVVSIRGKKVENPEAPKLDKVE